MATALKLYTKDQNLNAISKTVSNVNPVATDYVLKNFSEQLVNLSANTLQKVERVDTKDITNAVTDTAVVYTINSNTDFFSNDSDTYLAAVETLPAGTTITFSGNMMSQQNTFQIIDAEMKQVKNWREFSQYLNSKFTALYQKEFIQLANISGDEHKLIFKNKYSGLMSITIKANANSNGFVDSIYQNLVSATSTAQVPFRVELNTDSETMHMLRILFV